MARTRTLKHSFFTNEVLGEQPPLLRLFFQGLWCLADREGRLLDRPRRMKAEILPYDKASGDAMLDLLHALGFVQRYEIEGERYVQILAFTKHQRPHSNEAPSVIPAPPNSTSAAESASTNGASASSLNTRTLEPWTSEPRTSDSTTRPAAGAASLEWFKYVTGKRPTSKAHEHQLADIDASHPPECVAIVWDRAISARNPMQYAKAIFDTCAGLKNEGHEPRGTNGQGGKHLRTDSQGPATGAGSRPGRVGVAGADLVDWQRVADEWQVGRDKREAERMPAADVGPDV